MLPRTKRLLHGPQVIWIRLTTWPSLETAEPAPRRSDQISKNKIKGQNTCGVSDKPKQGRYVLQLCDNFKLGVLPIKVSTQVFK